MRKILASFLAATMVASMSATMTFALNSVPKAPTAVTTASIGTSDLTGGATIDSVRLVITDGDDTNSYDIPVTSFVTTAAGATTADMETLMSYIKRAKLNDVDIDGHYYNLTFSTKVDSSTGAGDVTVKFSPEGKFKGALPTMAIEIYTGATLLKSQALTVTDGNTGETIDNDRTGDFYNFASNYPVSDLIKSYSDGLPIPLTEKGVGVDKDLNTEGGIQSGSTLYFMLKNDKVPKLDDDSYWKIKVTKGDNGKYIKKVSDVTKIFNSNLVDANTGDPVSGTGDGKRHRYIKVELNDIYTDDEYKISLDMRISAKSNAVNTLGADDDTEIKVNDFYFYMKNIVKNADNDWKVGVGGLMLNPLSNDWNDVTYYDEDGDVAHMKFFADSDVSKFFAKLSTKWEHADYASYFNDQDAYIFDFVGSPKISSTSRCDLQIYNPFVNEDGNETIDPEAAVIYQVIDGDLFDVTENFTYEEGENGDMAFCTRTRFLGTYIICERAVEEAVDGEAPDTDLVPEDTTPVEVTPGNDDGGGKAPANTGKYL